MNFSLNLSCMLVFVLLLSSCTTVKPWQRNHLAKPAMQWGSDPQQATLNNHIYFAKEASSGGNSAAGGGCGCN